MQGMWRFGYLCGGVEVESSAVRRLDLLERIAVRFGRTQAHVQHMYSQNVHLNWNRHILYQIKGSLCKMTLYKVFMNINYSFHYY